MDKSIIVLSDMRFVEGRALDPASVNAVPIEPIGPPSLAAEPSSLALAFTGIGILGVYAVLKRWRPQRTSLRVLRATPQSKQIAAEDPKRGAA
jgi:hypothetical protein